jgi:hypothetical protein
MRGYRTRMVETRTANLAALRDVVYAVWATGPGAAQWTTQGDVEALGVDPDTIDYRDLCERVVSAAHANMEHVHGRKVADVATRDTPSVTCFGCGSCTARRCGGTVSTSQRR